LSRKYCSDISISHTWNKICTRHVLENSTYLVHAKCKRTNAHLNTYSFHMIDFLLFLFYLEKIRILFSLSSTLIAPIDRSRKRVSRTWDVCSRGWVMRNLSACNSLATITECASQLLSTFALTSASSIGRGSRYQLRRSKSSRDLIGKKKWKSESTSLAPVYNRCSKS